MRKRFAAALLGSFVLAGGFGCQPATVNSVETRPGGTYDWIKTDAALADIAAVENVRQTNVDGLLRVQVDIRNLKSSYEGIKYQFVWMDDGGVTFPGFAWQTDFIAGKQVKHLSEVAPNPKATRVRLDVQRFIQ